MCGLVGLAGEVTGKYKDMLTELLVVDSLRGMHSTGIGLVKRYLDEIKLIKCTGPSQLLVTDKEYKDALNSPAKTIIGHNRFATKGAHTFANAHPFRFEHVMGAHNGTLDHFSIKRLHFNEKFDTDSEAIFCHINEYGIEETVKQLSGAWALTWYDKRDDTINFLKNDRRPLFYTYNKERTTLVWASELEMLDFVFRRNKLDYEGQQFFSVDKDKHFSWKIPGMEQGKHLPFANPWQVELKAPTVFESKKTHYYGGSVNMYEVWADQNGYWDTKANKWVENDITAYGSSKLEDKSKVDAPFRTETLDKGSGCGVDGGNNVIPFQSVNFKAIEKKPSIDTSSFRPPYKGHNNKQVSKRDFNRIISNGCVFCADSSIKWGEFIQVLPDKLNNDHLFVCETCTNTDEVQRISEFLLAPV